jgi:hypothetical protein
MNEERRSALDADGLTVLRDELVRSENEIGRLQHFISEMVPKVELQVAQDEISQSARAIEDLHQQLRASVPREDVDNLMAEVVLFELFMLILKA